VKPLIPILLIVSTLFVLACSSKELLVYASEPYWESVDGDGALRGALFSVARNHGLRLRVVLGAMMDGVPNILSRELSRSNARVVVVDPLSSAQAAGLAQRFPSILFILMGEEGGGSSANVERLLFDRGPAFRMAGYASGLTLGDAKAGVILGGSRTAVTQDVSSFASGLADAGLGDRLIVRDLGGTVDPAAVQRVVNEMRAGGVDIFLPKLGEQNRSCLDALRASGGCAVTEDWRSSGAYEAQVFLSVEEDVAAGVDECLNEAGQVGRTVYGPVRLACGKAREVPLKLRDKISCR
jgi:basic membrane lipoprotein Med (substrate-binding protein (PBP1-ABC) superfamily)